MKRVQSAIVSACELFEGKVQEIIDKYNAVLDSKPFRIKTERKNRDMEVF